jgi:O-antigen/teichoic acid export membrane protein
MLDAVFPFRVILVLITVNLAIFPINAVVAALEKQPFATTVGATLAVVNITLDILLIPKYGITGALFAVAVVFTLGFFIWILWAYKQIGNILPFKSITKFLVSTIPMMVVLGLTENACYEILFLTIFSFLGLMLYLLMLRLTKALSDEDKDILMRMDIPLLNNLVRLL